MSMTESLRKLLRKMGGSPSNGDNSDELVSKIADSYSGGGGGGVLVVHAVPDTGTGGIALDKTWQEIHDALLSSGAVIFNPDAGLVSVVTEASRKPLSGEFIVLSGGMNYKTYTSDGYPVKVNK